MRLFDGGEVALVTGGSRGIGRATSRALAEEGVHVLVNYRQDETSAKTLVEEILDEGGSAEAVHCDVADEVQVRAMFRSIRADHGRLDVLVNSAGITDDGYAVVMSARKFMRVLQTNLFGTFLCCREALKVMAPRPTSAIVNLSSISGVLGWEGQANYAASKGAIVGLSKTLAKEAAAQGTRVNVVAPGLVDTDMIRSIPRPQLEVFVHCIGLGRVGTPEEIAATIAFLASPRASYTTGTVHLIDGGLARHFLN